MLPLHSGGRTAARPARVLLVDDGGRARAATLAALREKAGSLEARAAGDAEGFASALEEEGFHLAVVDGCPAWSSSARIAGLLRERHPECALLLLAPDDRMETAVAALKSGFDDCLPPGGGPDARLAEAAMGLLAGERARRREAWAGARLQDLLSRLEIGVYRATSRGVMLYANEAFCRIFGIPSLREAPGWSLRAALADPADEVRIARELRRTGCVRNAEARLKGPGGGERWISLTQTLRAGGDALGVVEGLVEDITARKAREGAARRREEEIRQARSLETVGRLAGGVAHDFNNLLTAINGYGELLAASLAGGHPGRESLEEILRAGARAAQLTRQLLAFGGRMVLLPRPVDLNALLDSLQPRIREALGPSVGARFDLSAGLGAVRADPGPLEDAILSLVRNAREAMPGGGRLRVATRRADVGPEAGANVGAPIGPGAASAAQDAPERPGPDLAPGSYALLELEDSGRGMEPQILERVFEPFFTTKPGALGSPTLQGGTGMGLSSAYGILRQSGGAIRVVSTPGKGTRVRLFLPLAGDAENGGSASAFPRTQTPQTPETGSGGGPGGDLPRT